MRQLVHDALAGAREMVGEVVRDLRGETQLSDDELLARYEREHRGRPFEMIRFAAAQVGGGDALEEALRYEREMEKLMRGRVSESASPRLGGG